MPIPVSREQRTERALQYRSRLGQVSLYASNISSFGIQCSEIDYQPSFYHSSYRCRRLPSTEHLSLMNEQNLKTNVSYMSLADVSDLLDHEPNVSRRDSIARSTSRVLMNKPSLFLADIFSEAFRRSFVRKHRRFSRRENDSRTTSKIDLTTDEVARPVDQIDE